MSWIPPTVANSNLSGSWREVSAPASFLSPSTSPPPLRRHRSPHGSPGPAAHSMPVSSPKAGASPGGRHFGMSNSYGSTNTGQGSFTPAPVKSQSPSQPGLPPHMGQMNFTPGRAPSPTGAPTSLQGSPGSKNAAASPLAMHASPMGSPVPAVPVAGPKTDPIAAAVAMAADVNGSLHSNRSFTPLPVPAAQHAHPVPVLDVLSQSLTQIVPEPVPSPVRSPVHGSRAADGSANNFSHQHQSSVGGAFTHRPRCPSFSQAPVPVNLNVYWQRGISFDENGRAQRRLGGGELSWGTKFLKDVMGIYHVGIEVHGAEYTFGNYHAPGQRQLGGPQSGVLVHEPQKPGPHCVFKQSVPLGTTTLAAGQVEGVAAEFGRSEWTKGNYKRIQHNCVDFARALAQRLGANDIPLWCYRGAATAKALGFGEPAIEPVEDAAQFLNLDATLSTRGVAAMTQQPQPQPPQQIQHHQQQQPRQQQQRVPGTAAMPPEGIATAPPGNMRDPSTPWGRQPGIAQQAPSAAPQVAAPSGSTSTGYTTKASNKQGAQSTSFGYAQRYPATFGTQQSSFAQAGRQRQGASHAQAPQYTMSPAAQMQGYGGYGPRASVGVAPVSFSAGRSTRPARSIGATWR
eukprot:gnl/TRDRNA2_/TRDRNA2_171363_c0_seq2.p1 gnl/TRDRNA2_/TRDRNA2_171363_c0~~gnl/TRDRNA2_/TRDRNA2_171363_c0_seq2.p1  ORF type:complete len:626 (-),score=74.70 gnl/TRDRNA2_/TRDRNA2_171363_c0_seq2:116-1993(-)